MFNLNKLSVAFVVTTLVTVGIVRYRSQRPMPASCILEVKSFADLRQLAPDGHTVVIVCHREQSTDNGGGVFRFDPRAIAPDDNALVIQARNASGRWIRMFDGAINVTWFGAVDDGVSDCTEAL